MERWKVYLLELYLRDYESTNIWKNDIFVREVIIIKKNKGFNSSYYDLIGWLAICLFPWLVSLYQKQ